jgi:hypothetical protein
MYLWKVSRVNLVEYNNSNILNTARNLVLADTDLRLYLHDPYRCVTAKFWRVQPSNTTRQYININTLNKRHVSAAS